MATKATKKMNCKEFKEAFNEVYDFDIWGYEGILNLLACLECREYAEYFEKGNKILAEMCYERKQKIHDILDAKGYYND